MNQCCSYNWWNLNMGPLDRILYMGQPVRSHLKSETYLGTVYSLSNEPATNHLTSTPDPWLRIISGDLGRIFQCWLRNLLLTYRLICSKKNNCGINVKEVFNGLNCRKLQMKGHVFFPKKRVGLVLTRRVQVETSWWNSNLKLRVNSFTIQSKRQGFVW